MFKPFEEAKMYAQSLKLKNRTEWVMFCKSGKRPKDIPSNPNQIYKEWHGMGDWLGTGRIADQNKVYMPFEESREFVRKLALKSSPQWKAFCKAGMKPEHIQADPNNTYKAEWKGYGDWLGTGIVATRKRRYLAFPFTPFTASMYLLQNSSRAKT
jgi:Phage-integrase repeat unit